ncbi:MAG: hypothetical protein [Caudoviricetes sp.]|nr:MAG: hypothetical protein [Caudoviricetes sp.]
MRNLSTAQIIYSKNPTNSYEKRLARFLEVAKETGMVVKEWDEGGVKRCRASLPQDMLKAGRGVYSHFDFYPVNLCGMSYLRIEYAWSAGLGKIFSICIHPEQNKG